MSAAACCVFILCSQLGLYQRVVTDEERIMLSGVYIEKGKDVRK